MTVTKTPMTSTRRVTHIGAVGAQSAGNSAQSDAYCKIAHRSPPGARDGRAPIALAAPAPTTMSSQPHLERAEEEYKKLLQMKREDFGSDIVK
ncbi:hypothetical protein B5X24_HaOG201679 [Helicoverpa armigera]|nr:hypothetical protein B5X24_HaOG201679 [Helicoverpa armigera]